MGDNGTGSAVFFVLVLALVLATSSVGGLVASRQPANPIGWIFCGFSAFRALSALAAGYAEVAPDDAATGLGQIAAWFFNWSFVSLFALAVFVLLLFPDGHLPGPPLACGALVRRPRDVRAGGGSALSPGKLDDVPRRRTRCRPTPLVADVLTLVGAVLSLVALAAAVVSVVVRYRTGDELARQQIKWLGVAALFTTALSPGRARRGSRGRRRPSGTR